MRRSSGRGEAPGDKKGFCEARAAHGTAARAFSQEPKHGYADTLNVPGSAATGKTPGQNIFYIFGRKIDVLY